MFFTAKEVELIRKGAAEMPLGGARDSGKAQLSSLTDYAASSTLEALVMDIDARERNAKISRGAARALRALVEGLSLAEEERRRPASPDDSSLQARALRHKRAMALRYVNKLRTSGFTSDKQGRSGPHQRRG